jgi:hypothetical protein
MFAALFSPEESYADINFTSPNNDSVNPCDDYFTSEWGSRIDMSNQSRHGDILYNVVPAEVVGLSAPSYANGIVSLTSAADFPYFRLLTPASTGQIIEDDVTRYGDSHPINPSEYSLLTFRMYVPENGLYGVRWDKSAGNGLALTSALLATEGWQTYQIDLSTAQIESGGVPWATGNNYGLAIYPMLQKQGRTAQLDWLQLTPPSSSCSNFTASYSAGASEVVSVFVDSAGDTDPSNGFIARDGPKQATGASQTTTLSSTLLYPDSSYVVYGISSTDYATHYFNPWDFSAANDVVSTINLNGSVSGGKFSGSPSAGDPQILMNLPQNSSIDASLFDKFSIDFEGGAGTIQVLFFDQNSAFVGARNVDVAGNGVYTLDLAAAPDHPGDVGTWSGRIGRLRIDPEVGTGNSFSINWISIGSATTAVEPSAASVRTAPGGVTLTKRYISPILMPDDQGGKDYFVDKRANPANMDGTNDIDQTYNLQNASLCAGSSYSDSGGNTRTTDFMKSDNSTTGTDNDGDPQVFFVFRDEVKTIDADYHKIACATFNLPELGVNEDHTVLRYGWEVDGTGYTGDDIVLKTSGVARYCNRMENMPIEVDNTTINGNFWNAPLKSFRIDPHEISSAEKGGAATPFIIEDVRLAADHEANTTYAVVVGGDRDVQVDLYKNTSASTSGGTFIGSLSAGRNTDVFEWNTSGETDGGLYYLYATVGGNSYLSPGPVKINKSYTDNDAPILELDAPAADGSGRYASLDLAGHALDNVRLATVEVFIDNVLNMSFLPDELRTSVRDAIPHYPFVSSAGFQKSIDLSGYAEGTHTLKVVAWDTAGNATTKTANFTKTSTALSSPFAYSAPNEDCTEISVAPPADAGDNLAFGYTVSGADIRYEVSGFSNCQIVRLTLASTETGKANNAFTTIWASSDSNVLNSNAATIVTANVPRLTGVAETTEDIKIAKFKKQKKNARKKYKKRKISFEKFKKLNKKFSKKIRTQKKKKKKTGGTPNPVGSKAYVNADCGDGNTNLTQQSIDLFSVGDGSKTVTSAEN